DLAHAQVLDAVDDAHAAAPDDLDHAIAAVDDLAEPRLIRVAEAAIGGQRVACGVARAGVAERIRDARARPRRGLERARAGHVRAALPAEVVRLGVRRATPR